MKHALEDIAMDLNTEYAIYSDSQYVINIYTNWIKKWKFNGFINSKGLPVVNQDIIADSLVDFEKINDYYLEFYGQQIQLNFVKGHNGDHGNDMADRFANFGADRMGYNCH